MNLRQHYESQLVNFGLFQKDATAVMDIVAASEEGQLMNWNDAPSGYPPQLITAVWYNVKAQTAVYLREHKPLH